MPSQFLSFVPKINPQAGNIGGRKMEDYRRLAAFNNPALPDEQRRQPHHHRGPADAEGARHGKPAGFR